MSLVATTLHVSSLRRRTLDEAVVFLSYSATSFNRPFHPAEGIGAQQGVQRVHEGSVE